MRIEFRQYSHWRRFIATIALNEGRECMNANNRLDKGIQTSVKVPGGARQRWSCEVCLFYLRALRESDGSDQDYEKHLVQKHGLYK
jgi:hypothetical protein